jgi:predicted component of type VI protein secretion system
VFDFALLIPLLAIFFVIGVPIMAVATHFVLRPLVRDMTGAIHGRSRKEAEDLVERVGRLEQALLDQGHQIDRLVEAESFRRQLEAGRSAENGPPLRE